MKTKAEILTALECCTEDCVCSGCPYEGLDDCRDIMHGEVAIMINKKPTEIIRHTGKPTLFKDVRELLAGMIGMIDVASATLKDCGMESAAAAMIPYAEQAQEILDQKE